MNKVIIGTFEDFPDIAEDSCLVQTHTTNPLLSASTVKAAIDAWHKGKEEKKQFPEGYDSLFGVNTWKTRLYDKENKPINHDPENLIPTQNLDPIYEENSCIYVFSQESLKRVGARIGSRPKVFPIPMEESNDIDTESDWMNAIHRMNVLENKGSVVWITGVCGGIGTATAEFFYNHGWKVIGTDINPCPRDIEHTIHEFKQMDCRKTADVAVFIKDKIPRLDCLVNNAALQICKDPSGYTEQDFEDVFFTNVKMPFFLSTAVRPLLKESKARSGGCIVNIGSVHSDATSGQIALYAMSKCAITGMSRSLAIDFAKDNIRVNTISPGATNTSMLRAGLARGNRSPEDLANAHINDRIGEPFEIAHMVYQIADGGAPFLNGQNIVVDGGATIKLSTE